MYYKKTEKMYRDIINEIPEILSILKLERDKKFIFDFCAYFKRDI